MVEGENSPLERPMSEKNEAKEVDDSVHYEAIPEDFTPMKKPKLEEKEENFLDLMHDDDDEDDGNYVWKIEEYVPEFESLSDEDKAAVRKYRDQYNESQGFQLDYCPYLFANKLLPVDLQPGDSVFDNCVKAVENVVKYMNSQKGTHLEFLEIICGTHLSFYEYYVKFKAKDIISGEIKLCQSNLFRNPLECVTAVWNFKQKPFVDSIQPKLIN